MSNLSDGPFHYRLNTWDLNIWQSVVNNNEYGFSANDPRVPWRGDVIDLGGHIGSFSWLAIHKLQANHIVVVEPDPDNFRLLSLNLREYIDNGRVEAINAGIGFANESLSARSHHKDNTGGNLFYVSKNGNIPSTNLDYLLSRVNRPVLLKMDCEGCEYKALLGCKDFSKVQCVIGEYHNAMGHSGILANFFASHNFAFSTSRNNSSLGLFGAHRL